MGNRLIFASLVGGVELLASRIGEKPSAVRLCEVVWFNLSLVDERNDNGICDNRTEFLPAFLSSPRLPHPHGREHRRKRLEIRGRAVSFTEQFRESFRFGDFPLHRGEPVNAG